MIFKSGRGLAICHFTVFLNEFRFFGATTICKSIFMSQFAFVVSFTVIFRHETDQKNMRSHSRCSACCTGYITPTAIPAKEQIKILKFKSKTAIYDFSFERYFFDIHPSQIIIHGTNGEIVNNTYVYLKGGVPQKFEITRNSYGANESLDGMCLFNFTGG